MDSISKPGNVLAYTALLFFAIGLITVLVSYGSLAWVGLAFAIVSWRRKESRANLAVTLNAGLLLLNLVTFYLPPLLGWGYLHSYSYFSYFLIFLVLFIMLLALLVIGVYQLTRFTDFRTNTRIGSMHWIGDSV